MTPADYRRRLEILADFARFLPGLAFDDVGIRFTGTPDRDDFQGRELRRYLRRIDRENRAKRPPPVEIIPLPKEYACPTCGMMFGTPQGLLSHQRKARH